MKKMVNSRKGRKEPNFLIITSVFILILLTTYPVAASSSNPQSLSPEIGFIPSQVFTGSFIEVGGSAVTSNSSDDSKILAENELSKDLPYMLGGTLAAIFVILIYSRLIKGENEFKIKFRDVLRSLKIRKTAGIEIKELEDAVQDKTIAEKAIKDVTVQESTVHQKAVPDSTFQKEVTPNDFIVRGKSFSKETLVKDYRFYIAILILGLGIAALFILTGKSENSEFLEIKLSKNNLYMLGGTLAIILVIFIYSSIVKGENEFKTKFRKILTSFKKGNIAGTEKTVNEDAAQVKAIPEKAIKIWVKDYWLYIVIPILCIGTAALLILAGKLGNSELLEIKLSKDILYMLVGALAAVLVILIYSRIVKGENEFKTNLQKVLTSLKIGKTAGTEIPVHKVGAKDKAIPEKAVQNLVYLERTMHEKTVLDSTVQKEVFPKDVLFGGEVVSTNIWFKDYRLYIAIPILCIGIAELLIFTGKLEFAVWAHIIILLSLLISNIYVTDPRVQKINMSLVLLPILRIINLSMPIFFNNTLLTFVFIYCTLAIPVAVILLHQKDSLKDIGVTKKNLIMYMILAIPLGFLLGLGEYMVIRPGYLIPDLTFVNLLKLTIIMVFFVGMIEELIFRSILQIRLEQTLGVQGAIVITSIIFGLMHSGYGTFNEMLYTCFVGFIIGLLFYKTKSLPFIAVLHGFVNVALFGILPLLKFNQIWI